MKPYGVNGLGLRAMPNSRRDVARLLTVGFCLLGPSADPAFGGTGSRDRRWMRMSKEPNKVDPREETPLDDPRQKTDWPNTKQTEEPWKGPVEKEEKPGTGDIDLEKHDTNTH